MKKFYAYLLTALAVVLVFAACGNRPNEPQEPENTNYAELILGTWLDDSTVIISPDGEKTIYAGDGYTYTYKADGHFIVDGTSFEYTIEGNLLTLYYVDVLSFEIITINETEMVWKTEEEDGTIQYYYSHRTTGEEPGEEYEAYPELIVGTWMIDSTYTYHNTPDESYTTPGNGWLMIFYADGTFTNSGDMEGSYHLEERNLIIYTNGEETFKIFYLGEEGMILYHEEDDGDNFVHKYTYLHRVTQ